LAYIYGVVFTNKIVKFGRASDIMRRVREHKTNAKQHDVGVVRVFVSTVLDDVREEARILDYADSRLESVSQESFKIESVDDVAEVFRDARMAFTLMKLSETPIQLIVDPLGDGYGISSIGFTVESPSSTKMRDKLEAEAIAALTEIGGWSMFSGVRDRMSRRKTGEVKVTMERLIQSGTVKFKPWANPFSGVVDKDITRGKFSL